MSEVILRLEGVSCVYGSGETALRVFERLDFTIEGGETVALVGPSGCGKSSLLHIAGLLDKPGAGSVYVLGEDVDGLADSVISRLRMEEIGFVFQFHHLLPEFDVRDNVALPAMIAGLDREAARARADVLLERVGLLGRARHYPGEISGGERQRVAIARALTNRPRLLIADEPTGNLDPATAKRVFLSLLDLVRLRGSDSADSTDSRRAALVATHNMELARLMDRVVDLKEGVLQEGKRV